MIPNVPHHPFTLGPTETDRACLLIHGFMGTPEEMFGLGEALAAQQIHVRGMVIAGHDGDPDTFLKAGHREWLASAEQALLELESYPSVFVCGLSMGGALALLLAARHPERIAGVIALSSLTRVTAAGWQQLALPLLPVARHFVHWFYPLKILNFRNPRVQQAILDRARAEDPDVVIDFSDAQTVEKIKNMVRIPVPAIDELVHLTRIERRELPRLRAPLYIMHSKRDQTVKPECATELYRRATSAKARSLSWLEHSDHVITIGPEKEIVYQRTISFIEQWAH